MTSVRVVALTKPTIEGLETIEQFVAYCARVSNESNQFNLDTSDKLLKYLIDHSHWSPFEMASATLEINTTRDIGRQILRHRSFAFQEFSQRYATVEKAREIREARMQDIRNRQNSLKTVDLDVKDWWESQQMELVDTVYDVYYHALNLGIAKEVARAVLPEGLTPSRMYMAGTVRSWIHYIALRSGNGTQKEHRDVALGCLEALAPHLGIIGYKK